MTIWFLKQTQTVTIIRRNNFDTPLPSRSKNNKQHSNFVDNVNDNYTYDQRNYMYCTCNSKTCFKDQKYALVYYLQMQKDYQQYRYNF